MATPDSSDIPAAQRSSGGSLLQILRVLADVTEPLVEWVICVCGWSAILFVLAIFAFVFREAFPIVLQGFDFREFFFSTQWRPDSAKRTTHFRADREQGACDRFAAAPADRRV